MSYSSLLDHRADVKRMTPTIVDGVESMTWRTVGRSRRCRLDLQFIRPGRDPQWTAEAGRPVDRTGVVFFERGEDIRTGDRIVVTRGPIGTFEIDGDVDHVFGRRGRVHHVEVGCKEVPGPRARASV